MFPKTDYLLHCDRNENTISVKDKKKTSNKVYIIVLTCHCTVRYSVEY